MESRLKHSKIFLTLLIVNTLLLATNDNGCSAYSYVRTATKRATGTVVPWPRSVNYTQANNYLLINRNKFEITLDEQASSCAIIRRTVERYTKRNYLFDDVAPLPRDKFENEGRSVGSLQKLVIETPRTFTCEEVPYLEMKEAYSLSVGIGTQMKNETWARLSSDSNWGIMRGIETFSQLIYNLEPAIYAVRLVEIEDEPRFKYRGYMLDTARHYLDLSIILETLDAMSFNKLNVFHWHMVDDQSFPFVSSKYPQISAQTAFRPDLVYTQDQVRQVVKYAAERGIRVLPELDTPGHTYALRVIKDVLTQCYDTKTGKPNSDLGPIDPTNINSLRVVSKLLGEMVSLFPDSYFHAGGDEVDYDCWKSNPTVNDWMKAHNISGDYSKLNQYYLRRVFDLLTYHNRTMTVWQEVFDDGTELPKEVVFHAWKGAGSDYLTELKKIVSAGYRGLLSSCWYLNFINYGQDWVKFYECEPTGDPVLETKSELVLGGEVCMWSEFVDETNVIARTWPRTSAAAERLWSPKSVNNSQRFMHRLEQMRCRLRFRDIQAEPVNGPGYC